MEVIAHGGQTSEHCGQATGAGQDVQEQSHILVRPGEAIIRCAPLHVGSSLAFTELLLDHPQLSRKAVCPRSFIPCHVAFPTMTGRILQVDMMISSGTDSINQYKTYRGRARKNFHS